MLDLLLKARNSRKKGFTIIELVIVIAIIGILSAVLIPNFSGVLSNASDTAKAANISTMNKIAKSALGDNEISMLKGYAAAVQNFGYENVKATASNAVYNSGSHEFIKLSKVKGEEIDLQNFYPVAETEGQTALEAFKALPFVETKEYTARPGGSTVIPFIINKAIVDDANKYNAVYVVKGSIALYDDLDLGDGVIVFTDGASVELNGKTLGAKAAIFLDTKGGAEEVKFYINGGMLNTLYGIAVTSIKDGKFWNENGTANLGLTVTDADFVKSNKIEVYQDAMVEVTLGGAYINVAKASYYLYGGIMLPGAGTFTLDGESHLVAKDGAYLLATEVTQNDGVETSFSAVKMSVDPQATTDVSNAAVVSLVFVDGSDPKINGLTITSDNWNSVNPMTYEICAAAVQNTLVLYAQAGADLGSVMAICDKFATSVNTTVDTLATAGLATALNAATATAIENVNSAMATSVFGAISSASAAVTTAAPGGATAAGAIASLAGATATNGALANIAANSVIAANSGSGSSESSTDYTFYAPKADNNAGGYEKCGNVITYHITTAKQLYTLSWIVAKGLDDFYGSVISIDADLDLSAYDPWQPIGNGKYGFRGTMNGNGHNISNMKIDTASLTSITSLIGQAWSGTANHAQNEGVNYGIQTGDKYAIGFIGVLENGGALKNVNFKSCYVRFNYNWNCSAAIAVGAVVSTGEDYSYQNGKKHITGVDGNGYAVYGDGTPSSSYNATGPKWVYTNGTLTGAEASSDINYRAYKGWVTTISNVTTDSDCYVECSGRPGGIVGSAGGRYSAGTPNNDYNSKAPWTTYYNKNGAADSNSIFCSFGTLNIDNCSNAAHIVQKWQMGAYCDGAGIAAYFVNKGGSGYAWNVTNCTNTGVISAAIVGQIVGNIRTGVNVASSNHPNGSIVLEEKSVRGDGVAQTKVGTSGVNY